MKVIEWYPVSHDITLLTILRLIIKGNDRRMESVIQAEYNLDISNFFFNFLLNSK